MRQCLMSMRSARPRGSPVDVAAVAVGLLLVLYGLGAAIWVSSSDSTTRFVDLTYGDPPYGFAEGAWVEAVARPYFNGGAWILLVGVTALSALALRKPSARTRAAALSSSLVGVVWTFAAVLALQLIDLRIGVHLPVIGYLIVAATLLGLVAARSWAPALLTSAVALALAAVIVWFAPVVAHDSSCSLSTRNRYDNRSACADTIATLTTWFVALTAGAVVLAATGVALMNRSTHSGPATQQLA